MTMNTTHPIVKNRLTVTWAMKLLKNSIAIFALAIAISHQAMGQVTIDQSMTPEELVQDILLGEGVTVFNVTFNGLPGVIPNNQVGRYIGPSNFVDFDEGVIMASGDVIQAEGGFGAPLNPNITGDPDLYALANSGGTSYSVNNCAILEFDFIPTGDSLTIRYVFTSQEYPSYTCSVFNDPFGFFVSGPGIEGDGTFTNNAINIATVPGSDNVPIAVNTINSGTPSGGNTAQNCLNVNPNFVEDSQYFVNNSSQPAGDIQFPGMTVTLVASTKVQCGEVYHIKLAIADASDGALDSGVFLEKGGFASNLTVALDLNPVLPGFEIGDGDFDDGVVAGCTNLQFCLFRPDTAGVDTAFFALGGSAIEGVQYIAPENNFVIFPPGVDTVCTEIITLANDLGSQVDSLSVFAFAFDPCTGDTVTVSASIPVYNEYSYPVTTTDVTITCPQEFVNLTGSATGGLSPYTYEWFLPDSTTSVGEGSTVPVESPEMGETDTYILMVTDACGLSPEYASLSVISEVVPPPAPDIVADPDTINCVGQTVDLTASNPDGFGQGDLNYAWSHGGSGTTSTVAPDGTQTTTWYYVVVTDECSLTGTDSIPVYFIPLDNPIALPGDDVTVLCAGDEVTLVGNAEGGAEPYEFQWQTSTEPGAEYTVNPFETTTYFLQVTDDCGGTSEWAEVEVIVPIYDPITVDLGEFTSDCPFDEQTIFADVDGGAGGFTYEWTGGEAAGENTPAVTVAPQFSTFYSVVVTDICGDTGSGNTMVDVTIAPPITATGGAKPTCNGESLTLSVSGLEGGAGNANDFTYVWTGPGIPLDGGQTSNGNLTISTGGIAGEEDLTYIVTITDVCGNIGEGIAIASFTDVIDIPNVITPNNDGMNDEFIVPNSSIFRTVVTIMDRWGKVVFESDNYTCDRGIMNDPATLIDSNCWEGADDKGDTYYYIIDVDNGLCTYQGVVHVLDNQ